MKTIQTKFLAFAAAFPALAACVTVGPDYETPQVSVSSEWATTLPVGVGSDTTAEVPSDWWRLFDAPLLDELIVRAATEGPDLRIAEARLLEARAARQVARADGLPSLEGGVLYERQRFSENAPIGQAIGDASSFNLYSSGFDAVWEIDVFGRTRRQVEGAEARLVSAIEDIRVVRLSIVAETARNYFELQAARTRLERVVNNVSLQKQTVDLTRQKVRAGEAPSLDLDRALARLQTLQAEIPTLRAQVPEIAYRIALLLGEPPEYGLSIISELDAPVEFLPQPPLGLRSEILRRRPDIRRAELELAAATADKGVAVANLYPSISLGGSLAFESIDFQDALDWSSAAWGVGPSLRVPIFEGGRLRALVAQADARIQAQAAEYEKSVLTALQEAEGALVQYVFELQTLARVAEAQSSSSRVVELLRERYAEGDVDLLSVLDAERQLVNAELREIESRLAAQTNLIALYKALGGGWRAFESPQSPVVLSVSQAELT